MDEGGPLGFVLDFAEYLGGTTWLYGRAGGEAALTVQAEGPLPQPGTRLAVAFDPADMRLFDERGRRLR